MTRSSSSSATDALYEFFVPHVSGIPKQKIEIGIGPCTTTSKDGESTKCDGQVDLVKTANTLQVFWISIWTFSEVEMVHCPSCQRLMTPNEYEKECVPLLQACAVQQPDPNYCPKCNQELMADTICPECKTTFLSKPNMVWCYCLDSKEKDEHTLLFYWNVIKRRGQDTFSFGLWEAIKMSRISFIRGSFGRLEEVGMTAGFVYCLIAFGFVRPQRIKKSNLQLSPFFLRKMTYLNL